MVQILQITLRTAEFKNKLAFAAKAHLKLSFGESEKAFPHPRVIKDEFIKFDGQRMSLSSYSETQVQKAYLHITVLENGKSLDYGNVEIDILKLKQFKDGTKVTLELQNQHCFLTLEALSSTYNGGTSQIDNKSQRSQSLLSPLRANSTIASTNVKQALENVLQYTPNTKQKQKQEEIAEKPTKTENKKDSNKQFSKTFEFNKKISLEYDTPKLIEQDRKSQISQRPVRQTIKRTKEQKPKEEPEREPSVTKSASNIPKKNESSKKIIEESPVKPKIKKEEKPLVQPQSAEKKEQGALAEVFAVLRQFQGKDYAQFVVVSVIAFIIGMIFKKF